MRSAVTQADNAATTAANTGTRLGADASGIGSTLVPFETARLEHPEGYSQQDESAMLGQALAGAGGATSGIVGQANKMAATSRNAGGFQAVLADAARQRAKGAAGASLDVAAKNADLKQQQQSDAAKVLGDQYKTDTSGMLDSNGQVASDVNAGVAANNSGWLQNTMGLLQTAGGMAGGAGGLMTGMKALRGGK